MSVSIKERGPTHRMQTLKLALLLGVLASTASGARAPSRVLFIITPGPQSHMYGMKKVAVELASRNHNLLVGLLHGLLTLHNSLLRHQRPYEWHTALLTVYLVLSYPEPAAMWPCSSWQLIKRLRS